jgi:branched-subunit amino acid transport protein AzlD
MTAWIVVAAAAVATYLFRFVPVWLLADREPPRLVERAGALVGPVAFTALGTAALAANLPAGPRIAVPAVVAVLAVAVLAALGRSTLWSISGGLLVLWTGLALA